jgi:two-component system sensor histidine kinase FlrB
LDVSEWDILASMPTALVIVNAQGRIVWLNPEAEAMLGYGLMDSLWLDVLLRAFVPREDDGHEVSLADGRRVHVAISCLESLPGNLITLSDITASRDYEQARENEKRLVSIGTMTAQLAHQIRTPLASAILYSDHLNNIPNLDQRSKSWIKKLQECHTSIEQQIQDLLLFARGTTIQPERMDMEFWCEQLLQRAQPYIDSYGAVLTANNQLKNQDAIIHAESLLGSVLNLIINSLQSEANKVQLTLASLDNSGIKIIVNDNGTGMSDEVKAQAFSPFFTTKAQGNGLGLAVVFAVVKAHGGNVQLESAEGIGTQITLNITGKDTI